MTLGRPARRGTISQGRHMPPTRDVIGGQASCVLDTGLTAAKGELAKVFGWYDNERGYVNRLGDLTEYIAAQL